MAYISHSPIRDLHIPGVSGAILMRSALVAVAAAGVMLALSETRLPAPAPATTGAAKADRLVTTVAPVAVKVGDSTYMVDSGNATTTVEKGATMPLSPQSPLLDAAAK